MQCEPANRRSGALAPVGSWPGLRVVYPSAQAAHGQARSCEGVTSHVTAEDEAEDFELVRRCRAGDDRAFELLFQRHSGHVAGLVYRMVGPGPDLEDLVQDVFLQVIRSLNGFRDQARFSTWLYRVAVNVVLMHRRAAGRRPRLVDEEQGSPAIDAAPSAEDALETRLRLEAFYRLLERLSDKKRAVFILHELEGLTPARISEIVAAPVLTVRTRLFYARRDLAQWLSEEPDLAGILADFDAERSQATASSRLSKGVQ